MVSTFFSYITTLWQILFSIILKITSKLLSTTRNKPLLPPGPKPWPIVGCIPQMILNKKPAFEWIHKLMEEMETEIACIRLGNVHVIPVTSPEFACLFLKNHDSIFSLRPICMSADLVSNGYLTSIFLPMGDQWMKMRRILTSHVLSPTYFHWLRRKRDEEADHLLRFVYDQCINKRLINLRKVTRYYCANVIKNMIFSKRLLGPLVESEEEEEQVDAIFTLLEYFHSFSISDYLPWLSGFDLDGHKAIIKKAFAIATKHIDYETDRRIHIWKNGNKTLEEDILDVLIMLKDTNGNPMLNAKEIKAQEFMFATIDNASYAVEWTIKEMLNQPKIMQRAIEEIDNVIGSDRLVQESDLSQLNYVKACIKESFRLHPLAAFNVPHVSMSDSVVGEYFIPKGSVVLLSRLGLGRNPKIWDDPMKFKPERHINEKGGDVVLTDSELRLLSFSIGRRGCPGVKLGSTITTMLLVRLLQGFTWSSASSSRGNDLTDGYPDCALHGTMPFFAKPKPRLPKHMYL
ncbi:PREDICTED: isoleucine N-monooxygenase 2-like [Nicotiana attenuata]|uniref:Isoleucine n-monooxygenase 2 n=1 Tax=Nicotiana attenuata TaxID=49451 RepID=A0A1J6IVZ0_NICAT|nr:PREDICTED: isoleucine N-monooxygenase 2-like [Nicotiana attenuata]OIT02955.1 isoleucine n-monooxygenase 2 [Nicotiana attenuata]